MKNLYKIIIFTLTAALLLSGCENTEQESVTDELPVETASSVPETTAETTTEITFPEIDGTESLSGEYVFDDAGVLSEKQRTEILNAALYISGTFKINCAVVIPAKLGGKSASEYAEAYYQKLYKGSNGIMFLINNDTGDDYVLRKGTPALFVTNGDIEMLFTEISPLLVTEKYADAVKRAFNVFAEKLPEFVADNTNTIDKEELTAINDILAAGGSGNESLSMVFTGTLGTKTVEDYAKEQYSKYYALDSGSNALMAVNIETAEYFICGTAFGSGEKDQSALKTAMDGCLTDTEGKKTFNCKKSAEIFAGFMSK